MVYLLQLPLEILDLIVTFLAISTHGAREIANISATCRFFKFLAEQTHVLMQVNFQGLIYTEDFSMHHHPKDLILVCTRVGNQAAKLIFAKALLFNDMWFRQMIEETNQQAYELRITYTGLLDYRSIIRSFILNASCMDLIKMREYLLNYVITNVGYNLALKFGILDAIETMCSEMARRMQEQGSRSLRLTGSATMSLSLLNDQVRSDRMKVLFLYDALFPTFHI